MYCWLSEAYLETSQTSEMEIFAKVVNGYQSFSIFAKSSILVVWLDFEYTSDFGFGFAYWNSSVIRQKGESQNGYNKKTKHAKFSEKRTFLTPSYIHVRVRIRG